ncbi:MAG TPA: hypothetical protein PKC18_11890 [Lacipirellulaceae bacterium]|nr:hypothetical protein [Lacipirellulaceae bacterium]
MTISAYDAALFWPSTAGRESDQEHLPASIVDAVLSDESLSVVAPPRRELPRERVSATGRIAIDEAHSGEATSSAQGTLLRQLARQLNLLESQQRVIRRLLEDTAQQVRQTDAP